MQGYTEERRELEHKNRGDLPRFFHGFFIVLITASMRFSLAG